MGSGGGGGGPTPPPVAQPISGVPIAGSGSTSIDPYNYGQYQSFLPDIPKEGSAPSAMGLTSDMFRYAAPNDILNPATGTAAQPSVADSAPSAGGGGGSSNPIMDSTGGSYTSDSGGGNAIDPFADSMRNYLANIQAKPQLASDPAPQLGSAPLANPVQPAPRAAFDWGNIGLR